MNECTLRLEWHCAITVIYHVTMLCQLYCSYIASSYHLAAICNACFFGATSLISAFFGRWTPNAVTGIAVVIDKSNRSFIVNQNTIFPSKVEYKYNFPNELSIPINWVRKQNLFWHFLRFVSGTLDRLTITACALACCLHVSCISRVPFYSTQLLRTVYSKQKAQRYIAKATTYWNF